MIKVAGRLICSNESEAKIVREYLPEHIRLSKLEPGCISFNVAPSDDPLVWTLQECFASPEAFKAHQTRTKSSEWWLMSKAIVRDFQMAGG